MASEYADAGGRDWRDYLLVLSVALGLAAGGFLASNLLSIPLVVVFSVVDIGLRSTIGYAASTIFQAIAFVLVVLGYMRYADRPHLLDIRWPSLSRPRRTLRDIGWAVAGVVILFIASQAVGLALQQFGFAPGTNRVVSAVRADPTLALYLIILSFLATGPGEETLFRGGVQGVLRRVFSPVGAVVGSSAFFGLAHTTALVAASGAGGVWGYVASTFVLGLVLGALYEYTDNLLIPILVHGAYNAVLFVRLYLVETSVLGFLPAL
jgi:membrane protease YdiL (CAAX protease family)